jgi:hypothetical protein
MAQKRKRDLNSGASGAAAGDSGGQRAWAKRLQTSSNDGSNGATTSSDVNGGLMLPTPSSSSSNAAAVAAGSGAGHGSGDDDEADELSHHTPGTALMSGGAHGSTPPQATTTSPAGENLHQSPGANAEELMLPQPRSEPDPNEMRHANAASEASAAAATAVAALAGAFPALSGSSTTLAGLEHPFAIPGHVPGRNPYLNPLFTKAPSPPPRQGPKPPVGSEEWHKVRRDNHKEGMCFD